MTGERRVGRHFSGHDEKSSGPGFDSGARPPRSKLIAQTLASGWGILIIFPGLVLGLGLFLTWTAQSALRGSNLELAQTRMTDEASLVAEHLGAALGQADTILDDLISFASTIHSGSEPARVAFPLRRMIHGRPGASYISVSFPDGTFEGAFVDEDETVRFQVSRILNDHTEERVYDYGDREQLSLREVRKSQYDPRTRPFYALALGAKGKVWTEPYAFARTGDTGITRTSALRMGGSTEHAVLTIDFDVRRLSPLLVRSEARPERPILFDREGTILADPQVRLHRGPIQGLPRLLDYRTLRDPVLTGFFEQVKGLKGEGFLSFSTTSGPYLAATADLDGQGRPDWSVAFVAPEASFLKSLESYKKRSYLLAAAALVIATLLSTAFARLIVRVRREASKAREAAKKARKEARELGSYRLVERLGVGGMGEVWLAEHRLLARRAAIKLIKNEGSARDLEAHKERFRREAQSLAALRSRNTIELFDYGVTEDGTFFYVMELLDGLDLETLVAKDGPQPPARVVKLLIQMCRSLAEAHDVGLVHRDVKPANIFVCRMADELDVVKVLDFGLVRSVSDENPAEPLPSATGTPSSPDPVSGERATASESTQVSGPRLTLADSIMGTPDFMAPEQALGGGVDARADLYALGCVAYWLLAGRTVFRGQTVMAQLAAHIAEAPERLDEVAQGSMPSALVELVHSCLAKNPSDRPQSATEIRNALESIEAELDLSWQNQVKGWWEDRQMDKPLSLSPTVLSDDHFGRTIALKQIS